MTSQEISSLVRYHYHPIIIILNNSGYTTERGLNKDIKRANELHSWNYEKLIEVVGSGRYIGNIKTEKDLDMALCRCFDMTSTMTSFKRMDMVHDTRNNNENNNNNNYNTTSSNTKNNNNNNNDNNNNNSNNRNNEDGNSKYGHHPLCSSPYSLDEYDDPVDDDNYYHHHSLSNIKDKIYCKEMGGFVSLTENRMFNNDISEDEECLEDTRIKEEWKKRKEERDAKWTLKSNYFTIIEIKLEAMAMSYGTQRFIALSQKKK